MKKIVFTAALFAGLCLLSSQKPKTVEPVTVKIAGLFSLTGAWSSLGLTSQEAMELAIKRINARMEETGSPYRFASVIYDTKLDTTAARAAILDAIRNNIHYVIGPQSSAELEAIRGLANENNVLVVSQGSTAGSLALAGDNIYRFCPDEAAEADAMAQAMYGAGKRAIITLTSNDEGNKGLQKAVGAAFQRRNGTVDAFPPFPVGNSDFSNMLPTLKKNIVERSKQLGADKVGVYLSSFDGVKTLFRQAKADPVFSSVHWYGGDAITLNTALLSDATAASFAVASRFFSPVFGLPQQEHAELPGVAEGIKNKTGIEADAYALAVYDATWVIARTVTAFPEPPGDFSKVRKVFQKEASQYFGITGPTTLNEAGDRNTGSFDYWTIVNEKGTYSWQRIGKSF